MGKMDGYKIIDKNKSVKNYVMYSFSSTKNLPDAPMLANNKINTYETKDSGGETNRSN